MPPLRPYLYQDRPFRILDTLLFLSLGLPGKEFIIGVAGFVVAFGLAVFIHELGHFLAAKLFKVPVERFVIGFDKDAMGFLPPCIFEKKIGETTYGLSLIPLGGYVKMSGVVHPDIEKYLDGESKDEDPSPPQTPTRPDGARPAAAAAAAGTLSLQDQAMGDMAALYKKPFWQKTIIYGAGVVMNMLLAMALFAFMFIKGFQDNAPFDSRIAWIAPDSAFANTELSPGDRIIEVNGETVENHEDLDGALYKALGEKTFDALQEPVVVPIGLTRVGAEGSEPAAYTYDLELRNDTEYLSDFYSVFFRRDAYIDFVTPNSPAAKGGLLRGDTVVAIDGEPVADWGQFVAIVSDSLNKPLDIEVARGEKRENVTVTPWENADQPGRGQIGVVVGNAKKVIRKEPFLTAVSAAPSRVWDLAVNYVKRLGQLGGKVASGNVKAASRELSGPAGIAQVAYEMSQHGVDDWLRFVIILNVALAVMNILPFPVLDGGHICFALYEAVFKRPVPPKVLVPLLNGAVAFILIFFVLVTFNDLWKIFF